MTFTSVQVPTHADDLARGSRGEERPRRRRWRGRAALAVLLLVCAVALLGPLFAPHAVTEPVDIPYAPTSGRAPLGTDKLGSDVLSRLLSGGRSLVLTGLAVTAAVCALGAAAGMAAAYFRGWTDTVVLRFADVLLGLPAFLLLSVVVVATGRGTAGVAVAAGLVLLPETVRVVRAATLRILGQDYVEVAVARGERAVSVLGREVLPNLAPVLAADAGIRFLGAVTVVATASFLGYGPQPPAADWGLMVMENRDGLTLQPLAVLVPVLLLLLLLLATNLLLDAAFSGPQVKAAVRRRETAAARTLPGPAGALLAVRALRVEAEDGRAVLDAVDLDLGPGELLAVVGESGSGKSTLARAVLGHVAAGLRHADGEVRLDGRGVLRLDERESRKLRASVCGYVAQDPRTALSPHLRVDAQITEVLRARQVPKAQWPEEVERSLRLAGLGPDFVRRRPHRLSGGQRQRVALAVALAGRPRLLVLDEPTSALDTVTAAAFVADLTRLRRETGTAALLVSHDMGAVASLADRVVVLEGGRIVEQGPAEGVLSALVSARGQAPAGDGPSSESESDPLLAATDVRLARPALVLGGVSLSLGPGDCLTVVGPSGSGKSTLLRCLAGLERPTGGEVRLDGEQLARDVRDRSRRQLLRVQLVPQDPYGSLNPRHTVASMVGRPLRLRDGIPAVAQPCEVERLLGLVGLDSALAGRLPGALSGGQRQRVALARALAAGPDVLLCDEVTSALDPSVAAGITDLIARLRRELGLAVVMVTHDLSVAARLGGQVAVLDGGLIRETGPAAQVLRNPEHEVTRALVAAVPRQTPPATPAAVPRPADAATGAWGEEG